MVFTAFSWRISAEYSPVGIVTNAPVLSAAVPFVAAAGGSGGTLNAVRLCVCGWWKFIAHRL
jgi:hypothetical protein